MTFEFAVAAALLTLASLPAAAQTRTIEVGLAGLMQTSTDLPPINLVAGQIVAGGEYKLLSGGFYQLEITSDGTQEVAVEGPGLFRNIWISGLEVEDMEISPVGLDSISFEDEGTATLAFVAIRPGQYDLRLAGTTGATQRVVFTIE